MIVVTGATGHLGRLVVADLLERGVPAGEIVAAVRSPEKAADLAARGVQVREADYDRPETLVPALAGADKLLFVSGSEPGKRLPQHTNVVEAAKTAGVGLIAYTGILNSETTGLALAAEHQATEALILASGLPYVFLRNGWYLENYTGSIAQTVQSGALLGAAGEGRFSPASRADFAAAAAAVLVASGPVNVAYELGGDEAVTLADLAAIISAQSGATVVYRDLPADEYARTLVGFGLPEAFAGVLADSDVGLARGDLFTDSGDLSRLIGRPTERITDVIAAALKA